jgi:hypothetical protein
MEVKRSTETLVHIPTTWSYVPEDGSFHPYIYLFFITVAKIE